MFNECFYIDKSKAKLYVLFLEQKLLKYLNLIINSCSFFEQFLKHSAQTVGKRDSIAKLGQCEVSK